MNLDGADLSYATLDDGDLVEVTLRQASLADGSAQRTRFVRCSFTGSALDIFKARAAVFEACDFTGARATRSVLAEAQVTGCTFRGTDLRDTALEEAVFIDCDFRDADLSLSPAGFRGSSFDVTFVRCDFRGANLDRRDFERVRMVDCKLAGTRGHPVVIDGEIERADLSEAADGSRIEPWTH